MRQVIILLVSVIVFCFILVYFATDFEYTILTFL